MHLHSIQTITTPLGIAPKSLYPMPFEQWEGMSEHIKDYVVAHPFLSQENIKKLLEFNAQYLVKIADYSKPEFEFGKRQISPLAKEEGSYQRDYRKDNKLLSLSIKALKSHFPDDTDIRFVSDRGYKIFLKQIFHSITIQSIDALEVIYRKIDKVLKDLGKASFENEQELFILLEFDEFAPHFIVQEEKFIECIKQQIIEKSQKLKLEPLPDLHFATTFTYAPNRKFLIDRSGQFLYAITKGGSTPTLQQSSETLLKFNFKSLNNFYVNLSCQKHVKTLDPQFTELSTTFQKQTHVFPLNVESQIHFILQKLESLIQLKDNKKFVKILGQGLADLLKGLLMAGVEARFQHKKMEDCLQHSLNRIHYFTDQLLEKRRKIIPFGNIYDLIVEEISLILKIAHPYQEGDFEKSLEELVSPWGKPTFARLTTSATQCFMEIIDQLRKVSKKRGEDCQILYFDDLYFENVEYLDKIHLKRNVSTHKVSTLESNFDQLVASFQVQGKKLHAIAIDIHSSTQIYRSYQLKHDVIDLVKRLKKADVLAPQTTIFIDYTIGMWGSVEVQELLDFLKDDLEKGTFQLILYRSAHKLDIFGTDKFNSGNYLVYCRNDSELYKNFLKLPPSIQPAEVEYQIYTHFYKFAKASLQNYYHKMVNNANLLYDKIDQRFIYKDKNSFASPFWITQKLDRFSTYLEICLKPNMDAFDDLCDLLEGEGLLNLRDSFGYREISLLCVGGGDSPEEHSIRITGGIDKRKNVLKYAEVINSFLDGQFGFLS